jgi:DNA-binding LytR/AlgR family response regulator
MNINCIIIDDEPLAHRVIEKYCEEIPFVKIVDRFFKAIDAIEVLKNREIDLIFLDINMPKLTGLEFLKSLSNPPLVIITTAYAEYALQGFELAVLDYLMKPFAFDRFLKAIQKAQDILMSREAQLTEMVKSNEAPEDDHLFIKSSKKTYRVKFDDILYIEALGDYVKIFTTERMIVSYQSLKNLEMILSPKNFPRIHKSFIVSLSKIDVIEGSHVKIRDKMLPVGNNFKAEFEKLIRSV